MLAPDPPPASMVYEVPAPRSSRELTLEGVSVFLRPVGQADYDYLFRLATKPESLWSWRYRGAPPSPESFASTLWQGVNVQFVICGKADGHPVGAVALYNTDFRNGVGFLSLIFDSSARHTAWAFEGSTLFLDHVFTSWNLRKIYLETLEFAYRRFASGADRLFTVEGCLRDYEFHDGQYWHKYILAIDRERWVAASSHYRPRLPQTEN